MNFLSPKTDITFKRLFGTIENKKITIDFLNNILGRTGSDTIVDLTMGNTNNIPVTAGAKYSIVDVQCTDQAGNRYIVEMQLATEHDYAMRAQYYSSFALSSQLTANDPYGKLLPVIFVGILNFKLFKEKNNYISHHYILDVETGEHDLRQLEFHFIELPKFTKTVEQLETDFDKWIYFLKNAESCPTIPHQLHTEQLTEAFHVLERGSWTIKEVEAYRRQIDLWRVQQNVEESNRSEGREEGRAEGRAAGHHEARIAIAQALLDILDIETIAEKTGLTIDELKTLKNNRP